MLKNRFVKLGLSAALALGLLSGGVFSAAAQDMPPLPGEAVIGDLNAPRGLAFDADGNLIVAVAGSGGDVTLTIPGPEGEQPMSLGMSGRIISIAPDGTATDWIGGFPSYAGAMETIGLYRAIPQGDSLWVIFSGSGAATSGAFWMDSVVELDAATLAVKRVINLNDFEVQNDPDGAGYDSNVSDIAWGADGTLYITDAGGNDLLSWTEEGGLQLVHAWMDNPVPTGVEVAENGDLYISFLGAGLAPGAAKIEHWSNGELVETFGGLNAVSDILLDGETLYAVELVVFGEQGPGPGRVISVNADGATPVAEGLIAPFGIAKGPDGALYVSYGTIAFAPGMTGGVVKLAGM
ncbi:MAG: ScyD/ScyE family protein [Anaerolineae bacterium]|nr:ScyD/ScyE family protein [Anaerolineae bacterium]